MKTLITTLLVATAIVIAPVEKAKAHDNGGDTAAAIAGAAVILGLGIAAARMSRPRHRHNHNYYHGYPPYYEYERSRFRDTYPRRHDDWTYEYYRR